MGDKDHLPTPEESSKNSARAIKKVTSTAYIGNPPVLTRGIDQVGIVARTTGEVRDTDFPILFDIDDKTTDYKVDPATNNLTYTLDLSKQDAHFHRLIIADLDVDAVAITNIDVDFENLSKNKELQFTIEFIKDPGMVATPTITFVPTLNGAPAQPTPFPDDEAVWYFLISARTLPDDTTRYELVNFGTGSGGANTFPILYPEENIGTIVGPTQNINISGSDGQFKEIELGGNVNLTFSGFPSANVLEEFWVLVNQDSVGGWTLTATGSTLKNAGTLNSLLDKTAFAQTLFHFVTGDGGTTLHANLVDLTASGGGFSGNLSDLVIDVNKDWNAKSITNLAGLDLFTTVANSITNVEFISFISDAAVTRGQIGRSDFFSTAQGITINIPFADNIVFAVDTTEKFKMDSINELFTFRYPINMQSNEITNILFLESDTPDRPGDGFIRMANTDKIRIRNEANADDLIIGASETVATNALEFTVAAGVQFTISALELNAEGNNLANVGNITKAAGAHDIGEATEAFTDIFAKYFRPVSAANTTKHGYTQIGTNQQFISYDSGTADSGFGIHRDGVQDFRFSRPLSTVIELFIGPDPFTSGETYRIQLGENSNSSAKIELTEGGNDLFIDRQGVATTRSVALSTGSLTRFKVNVNEAQFFVDANLDSNNIHTVHHIYSNNTISLDNLNNIGALTTDPNPGGFNYFVLDRVSWDTDPDTYIEFGTAGLSMVSDDGILLSAAGAFDTFTIASAPTINMIITASTGLNILVAGGLKMTVQDNFIVMQEEISMSNNKIVNLATPLSDFDAATKKYVDDNSGGGGGGGGGGSDAFAQVVKTFSLPVVNNSTTLVDDSELKFTAAANTVYYIEFNLKCFSNSAADIKFGMSLPAGAVYQIAPPTFGGNFTNPPTGSGLTEFAFGASTGVPLSANFFVVVEMSSTAGEVALSFAQNSAQVVNTFISRGSLMRVYEEGTGGGGGGGGVVTDVRIGTLDDPNNWYRDTSHQIFGNDNGAQALGITIPLSEPGGFTRSYTLTAADFPSGMLGLSFTEYNFMISMQFLNSDTGTEQYRMEYYRNGVLIGGTSPNVGTGLNSILAAYPEGPSAFVSAGDTIQIKAWALGGSTLITLEKFAVYTFPWSIECTSASWTFSYDGTNNINYVGAIPQNITTLTNTSSTVFPEWVVGGSGGFNSMILQPDSMIRILFGEFGEDRTDTSSTNHFASSSDQMWVPAVQYYGLYRTVSN